MVAFFKKKPLHIVLIPVFFCLHKLNEYFALIPLKYFLVLTVYSLGLSLALLFTGKLLFKDYLKAGYWTSILLIIFFFFGFFHDLLRSFKIPAFFVSWKFLLISIIVFIGWFLFYVRKKKNRPVKTTIFLNLIFFIFILAELGGIIYKTFTNKRRLNDLAYTNPPLPVNLENSDTAGQPDIFFIVFDEYASSAALEKYLDFDNSSLDSLLVKNYFYISKKSKSNYNSTPHSIASTFNLDYFNLPIENELTQPKIMAKGEYSFKQSLLPKLLEKNGYKILNYGLFNLQNHPSPVGNYFSMSIIQHMLTETLWGRIKKEIWWNVVKYMPWLNDKKMKREASKNIRQNTNNFKALLNELKSQKDQPKFVFAHIMMPHGGYFFNKHGKIRDQTIYDYDSPLRDSLFIDQLIYTNTWIDSLARTATLSFERPRVIIIEGDHGYREIRYTPSQIYNREKEFMNLNAYYFSDHNYQLLYDSISPVNSFRIVLNKYFNTKLPLLKDSTIFLH